MVRCSRFQRVLLSLSAHLLGYGIGARPWDAAIRHWVLFDVHFGVSFSGNAKTESVAMG